MKSNGESRKSPEQLEREVDEERAHIAKTLHALEDRLSPGQLVDQVMDYGRRHGGEFSRNLVDTVTHNPMPTLMTAIGVLWMAIGQQRSQPGYQLNESIRGFDTPSSASYGVDEEYQTSDGAEGFKSKAEHAKGSLGEAMGSASSGIHERADDMRAQANKMRGRMEHARHSTGDQLHRASEGLQRSFEQQPLALGAMGIALGALLGASFPSTRREQELMGDKARQVKEEAKHTAEDAYQRAKGTGEKLKERFREGESQSELKGSDRNLKGSAKKAKENGKAAITPDQPSPRSEL